MYAFQMLEILLEIRDWHSRTGEAVDPSNSSSFISGAKCVCTTDEPAAHGVQAVVWLRDKLMTSRLDIQCPTISKSKLAMNHCKEQIVAALIIPQ